MSNLLHRIDDTAILKISLFGYIAFKLTTFNLWFAFYRAFPIVSPIDILTIESAFWMNVISILSSIVLVLLILKSKKSLLILFLILEIFLVSTDMMRWQPTVFQILLTVIAYTFNRKHFKSIFLLILSATYIFSGLHKLNLRFINIVWCYSILIDFLGIAKDIAFLKVVKAVGFIIPLAEIISGVLIFTKWRKQGFYIIFLTHLFILAYVGPLGINYNSAIWPWNIMMLVYALIFMRMDWSLKLEQSYSQFIWMIVLFVLPTLNLANLYYPYFSFDLYSGSKSHLFILYDKENDNSIHQHSKLTNNAKTYEIDVNKWSLKTINVPTTHSEFLFKRISLTFKNNFTAKGITPEISKYPYKEREILELNP